MMVHFFKYQGAGNDFVLVDNRKGVFDRYDNTLVRKICDRRFGIGGDGMMLLESSEEHDFEMVYYNADGNEGSMCGNGGRCIVAFAKALGVIGDQCVFDAVDGLHEASIYKKGEEEWVSLKMNDVNDVENGEHYYFLDTGSPHYVKVVDDVRSVDVVREGSEIRYNDRFSEEGTNVNFLEISSADQLKVRTYERGVEDETLACGTGVTACAIVASIHSDVTDSSFDIQVEGGALKVKYESNGVGYTNIWLDGPAEYVFEGNYEF